MTTDAERDNHHADRRVPIGPFMVDFDTRICTGPDGDMHPLNRQELRVLSKLSSEEFRSAESLAQSVAVSAYPEAMRDPRVDPATLVTENYVQNVIHALRTKLGHDAIETKNTVGYRLKPE